MPQKGGRENPDGTMIIRQEDKIYGTLESNSKALFLMISTAVLSDFTSSLKLPKDKLLISNPSLGLFGSPGCSGVSRKMQKPQKASGQG